MLLKTIIVLLWGLIMCRAQNESRVVTIGQGPVRGYKASNSEVFEYFGIPYATAPTGTEKFKAPLPAPTWTETLEAVENDIACPQDPTSAETSNIREDCLIVNVFTPSSQAINLPVVVYIHGGAYITGFGMLGSPRPLVESQKIIAVTFNYRLGAHGFLCLGTEAAPGNAGLRDMMAALHWVKDNIASFGGNPDDVTLAGYSAGASAADLISLSKSADGLFNKVILDSGAHVATWSVQIDPIKNAQEYAQKMDFHSVGNLTALEEFYTTIPYELLQSEIMSGLETYNSDFTFVPCIENDLGQERVLDDSPVNIIRNNEYTKLPVLYGFANMEGMFRMPLFDNWAPKMNEKFSDFLVPDLDFKDDNEKKKIAQNVKEFYFGSNSVGLYTLFDYIDYFTDVMFAYPILRSVKLQAETGNEEIYLYQYEFLNMYVSEPGVPDVLVNFPGADHCTQTFAILDMVFDSGNADRFTEEYKQMRAQMRELWVNFITTGMPVPEGSSFPTWPPANASRSPHMILGNTITLGDALNEHRATFWDDIYDRYYRHPIPPTFVETEPEPAPEPDNAGLVSASIVLNVVLIITTNVLS